MKFIEGLKWLENYKAQEYFTLLEVNSKVQTKLKIEKNSDGFVFSVNYPISKVLYDKNSKFIINTDNFKIEVNNYIVNLGNDLLSKKFDAYIFQSEGFDEEELYYYKLLSPISSFFYLRNINIDDENNFHFHFNEDLVTVSTERSENQIYLVIESKSKTSFKEFKHITNSILITLGYLTGELVKNEEYFFQSNDKDWVYCHAFFYRKLKKSVKCYMPITSTPKQYSNFIQEKDYKYVEKISYLDNMEINNLVLLIYSNSNYFLAIRLLLEIFNNSFINRPSTLFVVLELLVNEVLKENSKPFIEKQIIKDECVRVLIKNKKVLPNDDYNLLLDGVNQIDKNLKQNNKKFEEAFKALDIYLNIEERKTLSKRNNFFHGKILALDQIIESEESFTNIELDYNLLSQRLYTLISKLILKRIGYSGYLINHVKLREKQNGKFHDEDYFIKI
ncbi:MAG: hypothetical protein ABJQ39_05125 [Winogradskyella arenosi]